MKAEDMRKLKKDLNKLIPDNEQVLIEYLIKTHSHIIHVVRCVGKENQYYSLWVDTDRFNDKINKIKWLFFNCQHIAFYNSRIKSMLQGDVK